MSTLTSTFKTFIGNKTFADVEYKILPDECGDARNLVNLPSSSQMICGKELQIYGTVCNGIEFLVAAYDPEQKLIGFIPVSNGYVTTCELSGGFVL